MLPATPTLPCVPCSAVPRRVRNQLRESRGQNHPRIPDHAIMTDISTLAALGVALAGATAVFVVSRRVLRDCSFGSPTLLAASTAGLAFFGLLNVDIAVLLSAGALGLLCIPLLLLSRISSLSFWSTLSRARPRTNRVSSSARRSPAPTSARQIPPPANPPAASRAPSPERIVPQSCPLPPGQPNSRPDRNNPFAGQPPIPLDLDRRERRRNP